MSPKPVSIEQNGGPMSNNYEDDLPVEEEQAPVEDEETTDDGESPDLWGRVRRNVDTRTEEAFGKKYGAIDPATWITPSEDLLKGEILSIDAATTILAKRLPKDRESLGKPPGTLVTPNSLNALTTEMARKMVMMMPEEMRTSEALNQGDYRVWLEMVQRSADEGDTPFTPEEVATARSMLVAQNGKLRDELQKQYADAAPSSDSPGYQNYIDSIPDLVDSVMWDYQEGNLTARPMIDGAFSVNTQTGEISNTTGTTNAVDTANDDLRAILDGNEPGNRNVISFMTEEERMEFFQSQASGSGQLDQLQSREEYALKARELGYDPQTGEPVRVTGRATQVNFDNEAGPVYYDTPDHLASERTPIETTKTYSLTEVWNMPKEMTRAELIEMGNKLERAGLIPEGSVWIKGDRTDEVFKAAWRTLVGKSLESDMSMMDYLNDRTKVYQDTVNDSLAVSLTDPARLRISADSIGQQLMGRRMTQEEHDQMIEFVHNLEMRNARITAGLSADGELSEDGLDVNIAADIDARMREFTRQNAPVETGAKEVADVYDDFTDLLAGPGRGGSF